MAAHVRHVLDVGCRAAAPTRRGRRSRRAAAGCRRGRRARGPRPAPPGARAPARPSPTSARRDRCSVRVPRKTPTVVPTYTTSGSRRVREHGGHGGGHLARAACVGCQVELAVEPPQRVDVGVGRVAGGAEVDGALRAVHRTTGVEVDAQVAPHRRLAQGVRCGGRVLLALASAVEDDRHRPRADAGRAVRAGRAHQAVHLVVAEHPGGVLVLPLADRDLARRACPGPALYAGRRRRLPVGQRHPGACRSPRSSHTRVVGTSSCDDRGGCPRVCVVAAAWE